MADVEKLTNNTKSFILWLILKQDWYYDSTECKFVRDGYRSRTMQELFEYYQLKINQTKTI